MSFAVVCARVRIPLCAAGAVLLAVGVAAGSWLGWLGIGLLVVGMALYLRVGTARCEPTEVAAPVTGRWVAINSPATRVPSHGMHAYGQTYAIDLVYEPAEATRPGFAWWPPARRPQSFPGFGAPVLAPAAGRVVRTHGWERDHWSRNSPLGLAYFLVESIRELLGPSRVLGNHVVLDLGDGVYAVLAHLRRRSLLVRKGDSVAAGQQLAACGNSGSSTEPHVHVQLMDSPHVLIAAGLPFRFSGHRAGMPGNCEAFATSVQVRSAGPAPAKRA
jgi:hypothetical protein